MTAAQRLARLRYERKAEGLCRYCGQRPVIGTRFVNCRVCRLKIGALKRAIRERVSCSARCWPGDDDRQ